MKFKNYLFIIILLLSVQAFSQSLSTNFDVLEDYYRREQLLGNIGTEYSFVSYPLFPVDAFGLDDAFNPEGHMDRMHNNNFDGTYSIDNGKFVFKLLPLVWNNQYTSHHPESINDGSMIPSKGYQTLFSPGFFFEYDHLAITFQPEYIYAANSEYEAFPLTRDDPEMARIRWARYFQHTLNYIDQPELFGDGAYRKWNWGQSSIRLNFNTISLGLSNENMWWGPGMRNSLIMTNTGEGFVHFTLNTVKPINTFIGAFEGQLVSGWLQGSGYAPYNENIEDHYGHEFYVPKSDDGRYFNGILLNYNPKWIPGLHLGLIRSSQIYLKEMGDAFIEYLPVFSSLKEKKANPEEGENHNNYEDRDQYYSVYMRYVWPESHVEIYGEYGRSSPYWDKRDRIIQLEFSNAYNLGFRKLIMLNNKHNDNIGVGFELTQLAKNTNSIIRGARSWYASAVVKHGYTHRGQLLGSGIGPGSNSQTINISWNRKIKSIGLQLERYVHNNDFHLEAIRDVRQHWVDVSASLNGYWDYKNMIFNFKLMTVSSKNYYWEFDINPADNWDTSGGNDVFNFQGQLGVMYRF